jgi:transcriptional regulator with XRE-family HTH domain
MADLCELDRTYISKLERGASSPTLRTVDTICRRLEIALADLVGMLYEAGYQ